MQMSSLPKELNYKEFYSSELLEAKERKVVERHLAYKTDNRGNED